MCAMPDSTATQRTLESLISGFHTVCKIAVVTRTAGYCRLVAWVGGVDALTLPVLRVMRCGRTPGVPAPAFGSARRLRWSCVDDRLGARKKWKISNLVRCGHVSGLERCGTHDRGP